MTWQGGSGGRGGFETELQVVAYFRRFGTPGWSEAWYSWLQRLKGWGRLSNAWSYGRRIPLLTVSAGAEGIAGRVQSQAWGDVHEVQVGFRPLPGAVWERVARGLAAEARYTVQLLERDLPLELLAMLASAGASLFPATESDIAAQCSCPDPVTPCKHVVQVVYHARTQISADPSLLLAFRGRTREELLAMLRALRAPGSAGEPEPLGDGSAEAAPDGPPLLAGPADAFWRAGPGLAELDLSFRPPADDALPVKQIGHVPYGYNKREFTKLMERTYQAMSAHALRLAMGSEAAGEVG